MDKQELENKRKEFVKLFLTAKFTQKEIADKLGISYVSANKWAQSIPAAQYARIRANLASELEKMSKKPNGNEDLIFRYIEHLNMLDSMIRKAKYIPNI